MDEKLKKDIDYVRSWACCMEPEMRVYAEHTINKIRGAVIEYLHDLDSRQHGGVAADKCLNAIQDILEMSRGIWNQK